MILFDNLIIVPKLPLKIFLHLDFIHLEYITSSKEFL